MKRIIDQMAYTSEVAQYSVLSATKRNVDKSSVAKSTMYEIVCFIQNIFWYTRTEMFGVVDV